LPEKWARCTTIEYQKCYSWHGVTAHVHFIKQDVLEIGCC
jgi:hypothetical protein